MCDFFYLIFFQISFGPLHVEVEESHPLRAGESNIAVGAVPSRIEKHPHPGFRVLTKQHVYKRVLPAFRRVCSPLPNASFELFSSSSHPLLASSSLSFDDGDDD